MAAVLRHVFCCCCGPRSHSPGDDCEANENTRLIGPQPSHEEPSTSNYVVNHQILKDRLGTIVRAKESKMVNVSNELPFNLANKVLHDRLGELETSASSSRSRSAHPVLTGASSGFGAHRQASFSHSHSPPPRGGRDPSPSILTSRSNSSLHPGDASYLPPEADPESGARGPILNARLVRTPGSGGFGVGGTAGALRQGRSVTRGRLGRFEDEGSRESLNGQPGENGEATGEELIVKVEEATDQGGCGDAEQTPTQARAVPPKAIMELSGLQDVGKITCSWGD